jgi:hypothetical protein
MKQLLTGLVVGLITFFVGVCAAALLASSPRSVVVTMPLPVVGTLNTETRTSKTTAQLCARLWDSKEISDEDKAVLAAQSFITLEGYTYGVVSTNNMAVECVKGTVDDEDTFRSRYDTLESEAYGVSHCAKGKSNGWTVVFRYTKRISNANGNTGRAVTMDENFQNLRVEHCDFFLDKVEKKLKPSR